ncbi:hypothetical protein HHI36_008374 [Cryptolaemus montrouzieri]|uniref:Replication factor C C-terminal domain-containing protein n=1 Tax=Cryptolaemus montrouzieri TaxID=559131 RepID=A0ABD2MSD7_9CUCU
MDVDEQTIHSSNSTTEDSSPIKISSDVIDSKPNQYFIHEVYNSPKPVKKETIGKIQRFHVQVSRDNNANEIKKFLKEYTADKKRYFFHFTSENLFKTFSIVVNNIFNRDGPEIIYCTERREFLEDGDLIKEAIQNQHEGRTNHRGVIEHLWNLGYAAEDIIKNIFKVTKTMDMEESLKLAFIKEIGITHLRIADGLCSLIQMSGLLSRLCIQAKMQSVD